jgi:thiamine biosynthesis lipoprotein ApbE
MAQWDPRSYLAQAAAEHFLSVDVNATATTMVDYYEAIAAHLEATDRHRAIAEEVNAQRGAATNCQSHDRTSSAGSLQDGVMMTLETVPSASTAMVRCHGVAFGMPFTVLAEAPPGQDQRLLYEQRLESTIRHVFAESAAAFALPEYANCPSATVSDLARFAAAGLNERVAVCPAVIRVAELSRSVHSSSTNGRFDPTACAPLAVWRRVLHESKRRPTAEELGSAWAGVGLGDAVIVDAAADTLTKALSHHTRLDFGAVAKGYSVDVLFHAVQAASGSENVLVEWGGDLRSGGQHPLEARQWVVGIPQPPSLNELYKAWHAGEALPEPSYRHTLRMPAGGAAVAASGDYRQLYKFGFTHIMDTEAKEPLRALAHTVCGATAVCPTCVEADAAATALMLERSLEGAVRLAMRFRGRNNAQPAEFDTQHPSTSVEDDAAGYRGGVRLLRYYLFERNHDAFVHDEDDERIGEGDDERRRQVDKYLSRDAAVHAVSQETAALRGIHGSPLHGGKRQPIDPVLLSVFEDVKLLMACRPALHAIAVVPAAQRSRGGDSPVPGFHAVLLSSLTIFPNVQRQLARGRPLHAACNVMRGSALFNHVREPGMSIGMHVLSTADAEHVEAMRRNHGRWMAAVTASQLAPTPPPQDAEGPPSVTIVDQLAHCAYTATVRHVAEVGDHLHLVLDLVQAAPAAQSHAPLAKPSPLLLRAMSTLGAMPRAPFCALSGLCHTVAVLYAAHQRYGKIGVPVRGLTVCSESPPMLSCFAARSLVTSAFEAPTNDLAPHHGLWLAFLGGGAESFVGPKKQELGEPALVPDSNMADAPSLLAAAEEASERFFTFLPFPSFRAAPGLAAVVRATLCDVTVVGDGAAGDAQFVSITIALLPEATEWTDFGRAMAALVTTAAPSERMDLPLLTYSAIGAVHVTELKPLL